MQVIGELRAVTDELFLRETLRKIVVLSLSPSKPMMIEQIPTLLLAIRTAPSSVSPVATSCASPGVNTDRAGSHSSR
jgi:hypothetical protein